LIFPLPEKLQTSAAAAWYNTGRRRCELARKEKPKRTKSTGKKKTRKGNATVFDDVYRTMVQKMPELMIPVINEIFHTNYPEDIEKTQLRNEHLEVRKKIITDSVLKIMDRTYHIECQSTPDGQMAVRMFEYGAAIALEEVRKQENETDEKEKDEADEEATEHIRFPFAAVLYLRSSEKTPDELTATVDFPDGQQIRYRVPLIKVQGYSLDEIFKKRLFLFLPFYILRYEKEFAAIEKDDRRLAELLAEYQRLASQLNTVLLEEDRTTLYGDMAKLITRITDYLLQNYKRTQKGVDATMGGKVLELYSEKLLRRGEARGEERGKKAGWPKPKAKHAGKKQECWRRCARW
jgi:hypothetical protein